MLVHFGPHGWRRIYRIAYHAAAQLRVVVFFVGCRGLHLVLWLVAVLNAVDCRLCRILERLAVLVVQLQGHRREVVRLGLHVSLGSVCHGSRRGALLYRRKGTVRSAAHVRATVRKAHDVL